MEELKLGETTIGFIDAVRPLLSDEPPGTPAAARTFQRGETLVVSGWIAVALGAPTIGQRVGLRIDDTIEIDAAAGLQRSDVAARFASDNLEFSGFLAVVSTARLDAGSHTLSVFVRDETFPASHELDQQINFTLVAAGRVSNGATIYSADGIVGNIDSCTIACRTENDVSLLVSGWACDRDALSPAPEVVGRADAQHTSRAVLGFPRPDVASYMNDPAYEACGFRLRLVVPISAFDADALYVDATSVDGSGRRRLPLVATLPDRTALADAPAVETNDRLLAEHDRLICADLLELERIRREAAESLAFDAAYGVETSAPVFFEAGATERLGIRVERLQHYEASQASVVEAALDAIPFRLAGSTFVDVGAGKGRVLVIAARRPFEAVIGVEINPDLVEIARDNLARVDRTPFRCSAVEVVQAEASTWEFPAGNLVIFMFNPFDESVLRPLLERLATLPNAEVAIAYHNPVARRAIDEDERFEEVGAFPNGIVYRRRGRSVVPAGSTSATNGAADTARVEKPRKLGFVQALIAGPDANWFDGERPSTGVQIRRFVELMEIIASRTLQTRYRGSVLGVFWSLSNPILMTGIYALIFGTAFASYYQGSIVRYVFATFVGLGVLSVFSGTTTQALGSIVANGDLLNKVRLPFSIFPISAVAANFFQFFIGTFPVLCIVTAIETHNPVNVLALFVPALALIFVAIGFSLLTSALYVYFRDLPYMYEMVMFIVWITSPIFYPASLVPARVQHFLALNPIIYIVLSIRQIALTKEWPDPHLMGAALLSGSICMVIGAVVFTLLRRDFMDLL